MKEHYTKGTFGKLLTPTTANKLLAINEIGVWGTISTQRNYITHNIYSLHIELIDETIN